MSGAPHTGGTAFPLQDPQAIHAYAAAAIQGITDQAERDRIYNLARAEAVGGLTVRDWFAGQALQGMLAGHFAHYGHESHWLRTDIANEAFGMADSMLYVREKGGAATTPRAGALQAQLKEALRGVVSASCRTVADLETAVMAARTLLQRLDAEGAR